jgi:hypothetical protein
MMTTERKNGTSAIDNTSYPDTERIVLCNCAAEPTSMSRHHEQLLRSTRDAHESRILVSHSVSRVFFLSRDVSLHSVVSRRFSITLATTRECATVFDDTRPFSFSTRPLVCTTALKHQVRFLRPPPQLRILPKYKSNRSRVPLHTHAPLCFSAHHAFPAAFLLQLSLLPLHIILHLHSIVPRPRLWQGLLLLLQDRLSSKIPSLSTNRASRPALSSPRVSARCRVCYIPICSFPIMPITC